MSKRISFIRDYKKLLTLILIAFLCVIGISLIQYNRKANSGPLDLTTLNMNEPLASTHNTPVHTGSFLASTDNPDEIGTAALTSSYIETALVNPDTNFLLNYNTEINLTQNKSNIWFENIEGNKYRCQIIMVNTDNKVLYISPLLSPNQYIKEINTIGEINSDLTVHCLLFSLEEQDKVVKGVQSFILKLK